MADSHLDWAQAALLTGILPNPTRWNPGSSPDASIRQARRVFQKLRQHEVITEDQYLLAVEEFHELILK